MFVDPSEVARRKTADIMVAVDAGTILAERGPFNTGNLGYMLQHFERERVEMDWDNNCFLHKREEVVGAKEVEIVSAKTQYRWECPWETAGKILAWLAVGWND